jgi:hypothetical protein
MVDMHKVSDSYCAHFPVGNLCMYTIGSLSGVTSPLNTHFLANIAR